MGGAVPRIEDDVVMGSEPPDWTDGWQNWVSSRPVHIRWNDLGPFWFPGLPMAIIFGIAALLSHGLVSVRSLLLAVIGVLLFFMRTIVLVRTRRR
jgi:hypothetical protein